MKGARPPKGFTIVETLIFLAITGALFISVMALISGKQAQTDFDQSIRDFQLELQSLIANVNNGYDNTTANFKCDYVAPGTPTLGVAVQDTVSPPEKGTNLDCIYVGEAIQFSPAGRDATGYNVYTLVGSRVARTGDHDSLNLSEAQPIAVGPGSVAPFNSISSNNIDRKFITGGTGVKKVTAEYLDGAGNPILVPVGTIAFTTTFPSLDNATQKLSNGTFAIDVSAIGCSYLNESEVGIVDRLQQELKSTPGSCLSASPMILNPDLGIHICLKGGTDQEAVVTIGGSQNGNGQGALTLKVYDGDTAPTGVCSS